jgi:hypothetical protein
VEEVARSAVEQQALVVQVEVVMQALLVVQILALLGQQI